MSGFLSPKFLKYRLLARRGKIDRDLPCPRCGYNLRGLNYGRNCPECGATAEPEGVLVDLLLSGRPSQWLRWRTGLAAGFACVVVAIVARLAMFFGFTGTSTTAASLYLWLGLIVSVVWALAAWMMTPRSLDRRKPGVTAWRMFIRFSQLLWPVAYACWILTLANTSPDLELAQRALRLTAGVGAVALAFLLCRAAESAELYNAARRLNVAGWFLPVAALLPQLFPNTMPWIWLGPYAMFLGLWAWMMVLYALGLLELQRHVSWATVHAADEQTRPQRVAETRRTMDRAIQARIRPLEPDLPELPVEEPADPPEP